MSILSYLSKTGRKKTKQDYVILDQLSHVHEEAAEMLSPHLRARAKLIRRLMAFRRIRDQALPELVGADANWVILVELYLAAMEQRRESISSLCVASGAPSTTALRYIKSLTDNGMVTREPDPEDGRRVFVSMAPLGIERMAALFNELERLLAEARTG